MTVALLWIACAIIAGLITGRVARATAASFPIRRRNYRGIELPSGLGVSIAFGMLGAFALVALLDALFASERLREAAVASIFYAGATLGFGVLGLFDDLVTEPDATGGWRAHLSSLMRGRPSGGAVKLGGGAALALVLAAPGRDGFWWTLADAAIVAMAANLFNLLDLRPGRAGKWFGVAAIPMLFVGGPTAPALAAGLGATAAFLPLDLRERAMLGDAGANAIGAVIGLTIIGIGSDPARLVAFIALAMLTVLGERPGLSRVVEAVAPVRALDRIGRVER